MASIKWVDLFFPLFILVIGIIMAIFARQLMEATQELNEKIFPEYFSPIRIKIGIWVYRIFGIFGAFFMVVFIILIVLGLTKC